VCAAAGAALIAQQKNAFKNTMTASVGKVRSAYFVTPHGFGHASRSAAVMQALDAAMGGCHFEIFTAVPEWFFEVSAVPSFTYHGVTTDIGVVQRSALEQDIPATVRALDAFLPFDDGLVGALAARVAERGCRAVLCDIAPLGLAVADAAGLPGVLIENFTWDWIYESYAEREPGLRPHIDTLAAWFARADAHVQTEPVCRRTPGARLVAPVSRAPRSTREAVRGRLGLADGDRAVMITMGGIPGQYIFLHELKRIADVFFVIPGVGEHVQREGNLFLIPHHSDYFHPDLVNACDAVIGKVGYSTLAEVYRAGVPFGYVARSDFRESSPLVAFVEERMRGIAIGDADFSAGRWVSDVERLLGCGRVARDEPNGADGVAEAVRGVLGADGAARGPQPRGD
jgi:hypothetical protein